MALDKILTRVIADIALEINMDPRLVKEIIWSQFAYVNRIMKRGGFDSVMLPYLGKFRVKPNRPYYASKHKMIKDKLIRDGVLRDTKRHASPAPSSPQH